jgi:hypothetical protein
VKVNELSRLGIGPTLSPPRQEDRQTKGWREEGRMEGKKEQICILSFFLPSPTHIYTTYIYTLAFHQEIINQ